MMKLTGRTKEQFEKWYLLLIRQQRKDYDKFSDDQVLRKFYRLLKSQQWGVIQDFADSLGYHIQIVASLNQTTYSYEMYDKKREYTGKIFHTRQESRDAAIEKFNEINNAK
jgi:hypothetical protein